MSSAAYMYISVAVSSLYRCCGCSDAHIVKPGVLLLNTYIHISMCV